MTAAVPQQTRYRHRNISFAVTVFCCIAFFSSAASAAISWKRVGTVTTLTNNQMCYTDGTNVVCDSSAPTLSGGSVGIGTTTPGDTLTINGDVGYMLGADYTTTGSQSDVNLGAVSAVRYNGTAAATFQGIVAGTSGQILYLHNPSAYTLTLADQSDSTDATAANKIITGTGADLPIPTQTSVTMQYDSASARWRVTGSSNAAKSLPAGSTGQVQFNNAGAFGATANFFWDNTNSRLAIGTSAAPLSKLDIYGGVAVGTSYAGVSAAPTNGMIVQGNVGIGTTGPDSQLEVSSNTTGAAGGVPTGTLLHVMNANSSYARVLIDTFGSNAGGILSMRGAEGTAASPTASQSGDILGQVGAFGYGATGYSSAQRSVIQFIADQAWTDSAQGTDIKFTTTPDGSTTTAEAMRITATGNVGIGTTNPANTLDVAGSIHFGPTAGTGYLSNAWVAGNTRYGAMGSSYFNGTNWITNPTAALGSNYVAVVDEDSVGIRFYTQPSTGNTTRTDTNATFETYERVRIDTSGNVGIGTTSPATGMKVDINGPVKVAGTGSEACTASTVGGMRYNATGNYLEICSYP